MNRQAWGVGRGAWWVAGLVCFLLSTPYAQRPTPYGASAADEAEQAWARRAEPGQTEKAIELWRQALREDPGRTDLFIPLTKALGRAYRRADKKADRLRLTEEALGAGREAVAKNPHNSLAYTYCGEALGQYAEARRTLSSLKMTKEAVAMLQKAVQLDPANAYAHMLLSQFYGQAPRFVVGDKKKGLEEARLAVRYGPQYAITHLALARNLKNTGHRDEAIEELKKVLSMPAPPDAAPEAQANKEDACQELKALHASCETKIP